MGVVLVENPACTAVDDVSRGVVDPGLACTEEAGGRGDQWPVCARREGGRDLVQGAARLLCGYAGRCGCARCGGCRRRVRGDAARSVGRRGRLRRIRRGGDLRKLASRLEDDHDRRDERDRQYSYERSQTAVGTFLIEGHVLRLVRVTRYVVKKGIVTGASVSATSARACEAPPCKVPSPRAHPRSVTHSRALEQVGGDARGRKGPEEALPDDRQMARLMRTGLAAGRRSSFTPLRQ